MSPETSEAFPTIPTILGVHARPATKHRIQKYPFFHNTVGSTLRRATLDQEDEDVSETPKWPGDNILLIYTPTKMGCSEPSKPTPPTTEVPNTQTQTIQTVDTDTHDVAKPTLAKKFETFVKNAAYPVCIQTAKRSVEVSRKFATKKLIPFGKNLGSIISTLLTTAGAFSLEKINNASNRIADTVNNLSDEVRAGVIITTFLAASTTGISTFHGLSERSFIETAILLTSSTWLTYIDSLILALPYSPEAPAKKTRGAGKSSRSGKELTRRNFGKTIMITALGLSTWMTLGFSNNGSSKNNHTGQETIIFAQPEQMPATSLYNMFPFKNATYKDTLYGISLDPITRDDWIRVAGYHDIIVEAAKRTKSGFDRPDIESTESAYDIVRKWGYNPGILFLAIMLAESKGKIKSSDGLSFGLFQVTPGPGTPTAEQLEDPQTNINAALKRILDKVRRYPFSAIRAIQAYNTDTHDPDRVDYGKYVIALYRLILSNIQNLPKDENGNNLFDVVPLATA